MGARAEYGALELVSSSLKSDTWAILFLGLIALGILLFAGHRVYTRAYTTLDRELDQRLLNAAEEAKNSWQAGYEDPQELKRLLAAIRSASQLENLFIFDQDQKSLADARSRVAPGKQYTMLQLSLNAVEKVKDGENFLNRQKTIEGHAFRDACLPIKLSATTNAATVGAVLRGGVYAQAGVEFEAGLERLRQNWLLANILSSIIVFTFIATLLALNHRFKKLQHRIYVQSRVEMIHLLSSGMMHEIKTPLATIHGSGQLLQKRLKEDPEHGELADYIVEESSKIEEILNTSLGSSITKENQEVDIEGFVTSLIRLLNPTIRQKQVRCETFFDTQAIVQAAPLMLRLLFANIIRNALDAVQPINGQLQIFSKIEGNQIGISIQDNGPGIPRKKWARLLEPLSTTKSQGSGLGLAVANQVVRELKGRLEMNSREGVGTTITVWLKLAPNQSRNSE